MKVQNSAISPALDAALTALVPAIRQGDTAAFNQVFEVLYPRLYRQAHKLCATSAEAQDVVMESFLAVWERREALPALGSLTGYLCRTVHKKYLMHVRESQRRVSREQEYTLSQAVQLPCGERTVLHNEEVALVESAVSSLPPQRQKVYRLLREQGMSYEEVAKTLALSRKSVKTHMNLALRSLRMELKPYFNILCLLLIHRWLWA